MHNLHAVINRAIASVVTAASFFVFSPTFAFGQVRSVVYVDGLDRPVEFVQDPLVSSVQYVVQQGGRVRIVSNGTLQPTDFLDLTDEVSGDGEQGLLGLAFAPDYATSGRVFVDFTNLDGHTVIARFTRSDSHQFQVNPASRFDLRWGGAEGSRYIPQPFSNHNGGHIAFGTDGYLYISKGDGGGGGDPNNYAQDPGSLLGKILRIDVNVPDVHTEGYVIPTDNPFAQGGALPEIWAFGLRNPWKFSFDLSGAGGSGTGAMLIGDVGQSEREEINYEPAGAGGRNYGWSIREGLLPWRPDRSPAFLPLTEPILDYTHGDGRSVTGGYVYRGSSLASGFRGRYFFADFVFRRVWSVGLSVDGNGEAVADGLVEHSGELGGDALGNISSFGVDSQGELYILSFTGTIFKIVDDPSAPPGSIVSNVRLSITPPSGGNILGPALNCGAGGSACGVDLPRGAIIGLDALPSSGFVFAGWTGDADCSDGLIVMSTPVTCSATFTGSGSPGPPPPPPPPPPSGSPSPVAGLQRLTIASPAGGTILGAGIICGAGGNACDVDLPSGAIIGLDVQAAAGFSFSAWTGDSDCLDGLVLMTMSLTCSATFAGAGSPPPPPPPSPPPSGGGLVRLTVAVNGSGTVRAAGIVCGNDGSQCTVDLPAGVRIGFDMAPSPGFAFSSWSGAGCGTLIVLDEPRTCTATFVAN